MRIFWIGFGQAGGKVTNTLMATNRKIYDAIAINTEEADLADLGNIRDKVLIGRYKQRGRGVGADIELGADIARKALSHMMDRVDIHDRRFDPEAFWIVGGLAGGTGAGGLVSWLKNSRKSTISQYMAWAFFPLPPICLPTKKLYIFPTR